MKLEEKINSLISEIEDGMIKKQINTTVPEVSLEYQTQLTAYTSTAMGLIEKLDTMEAEFFVKNRHEHKSDNSVKKTWDKTNEGIRQKFWENRIERMLLLIRGLEKIYYHGRDERKFKELK